MTMRMLVARACRQQISHSSTSGRLPAVVARGFSVRASSSSAKFSPDKPGDDHEGAEQPERPALTDQQKENLKLVWGDYIDYMSHQREKGWKT
mmetsp:Transcript_3691/g.9492  ORF Transcript_3691/g.9492 Transcript_3691/m.9492 type:complete len:93 (+) Transcript_3691:130-408(+)